MEAKRLFMEKRAFEEKDHGGGQIGPGVRGGRPIDRAEKRISIPFNPGMLETHVEDNQLSDNAQTLSGERNAASDYTTS
jgi:hypothetical protein